MGIFRLIFIIALTVFTFPLFSYAENQNIYTNDDIGFSISAPPNWIIKKSQKIRGNLIGFFSEENGSETPDVGISIDTLKPGMKDINDFASAVVNIYLNKFRASITVPLKEVNFKNTSGVMVGIISPQGSKGRVRVTHYFFQKNQKILSVMFHFMDGSDLIYNQHHKHILDSLKFK